MNSMRFILIVICLTASVGGCGNMQFQVNEKPEDVVIMLEKLQESPQSKFRDFKIGDNVAIIRDDGVMDISGRVEEISGKITYAAEPYRGRRGRELWMPSERAVNLKGDEKTAAPGYKVQIGEGRFIRSEWFPSAQIFPAPWANAAKLKVGDTVYRIRFGDFPNDKGVITELPKYENGAFSVRFDGTEKDERVEREKLFSSIEPAAADDKLSTGDIVYYNRHYWAMIVGKQDRKIIIREAGFPARDKLVDVSKIQIMR